MRRVFFTIFLMWMLIVTLVIFSLLSNAFSAAKKRALPASGDENNPIPSVTVGIDVARQAEAYPFLRSGNWLAASDPVSTVNQYLRAWAAGDAAAMKGLVCAGKQADIESQVNVLKGYTEVTLVGADCQREGESNIVRCQGKVAAFAGDKWAEFPLGAYQLVQENDTWKWCGEVR
jgi:hypothetical protein